MAWFETDEDEFDGIPLRFEAQFSSGALEDLRVFVVSRNQASKDVEITDALSDEDRAAYAAHVSGLYEERQEQIEADGECGFTLAKADIECPNRNGRGEEAS